MKLTNFQCQNRPKQIFMFEIFDMFLNAFLGLILNEN